MKKRNRAKQMWVTEKKTKHEIARKARRVKVDKMRDVLAAKVLHNKVIPMIVTRKAKRAARDRRRGKI